MKYLIYSKCGEGAQIATKIESEGHDVRLFIEERVYSNVFDGIVDKVDNPEEFIDEDTTIIFDISGCGDKADEYRSKGYHVYGASKFADDLEQDRNFGFGFMEKSGIRVPEFREFKDFKSGIEYVQASKNRLVFKPNGKSLPCKLTYVSDDSKQLIEYLKFMDERFSRDIDSFILQEFIEGIVISSEIFVSMGKPLYPCNHTVEEKKSMNDGLGPSTGCSGNITWNSMSRVIEEGVYKILDHLPKDYCGQIDLNAVFNDKGVYGLEWTPRFGYDATPTYLTLLDIQYSELFYKAARGERLGLISSTNDYAGSVRVSIPPYPMEVKVGIDTEKFSPNEGIPIQGWEKYQEDLYFYEVMMKGTTLVHSGGTGVIAIGLGKADTPEGSLEYPYKILEDIKVPDKQYRTDLKEVLGNSIKEFEDAQ